MNKYVVYQSTPGQTLQLRIYKNDVVVGSPISFPEISNGLYSVALPDQSEGRYFVQALQGGEVVGADLIVIEYPQVEVTRGVVGSSPSADSFTCSTLSSIEDCYLNMVCTFTSGDLTSVPRQITGYDSNTKTLTFEESFPATPAEGDRFSILGIIA